MFYVEYFQQSSYYAKQLELIRSILDLRKENGVMCPFKIYCVQLTQEYSLNCHLDACANGSSSKYFF